MFKFEISNLFTTELCVFFISLLFFWYVYYLYCFMYWKLKNVPHYLPYFLVGNITKAILGKENLFISIEKFYRKFKRAGHRHAGLYFFNGPVYLPIDPQIIKSILTMDFEYFVDRGMFIDEKFPLTGHLFSLYGNKWKNLRSKLTPTFSSGKMKSMYNIFVKITGDFIDTLEPIAKQAGEVNIKRIAASFTADVISSTAFGVESNSLKNPSNEFSQIVFKVFNPNRWLYWKTILLEGFQNPGKLLRVMQSDRNVEDFFKKLVKKAIKFSEDNKFARKDFMSLLLEVRDKEGLSFNEILAQCFLFFVAGFETSSQTISFCVHELAHNQDLQQKLRDEIFETLGPDYRKYSYDGILKMPYLDKVLKVLGVLNRICVKSYQVPGTDVVIEEGTPVLISALGLQRDPDYFPDPLKFDPERFNEAKSHIPCTYMPFGEGPRFCIGMRFGQLQTKLGIAALISQFKFLPSQKTPKYIEFDRLAKTPSLTVREGITVKITKL